MDKECYLCKSKEKDEVKYGEFMTRGKISVHYFCLLLSSNLMQNGHDNEGILGFLPRDIQDEERRVKPLICCYCHKSSANISCCAARCYKSFHLTCGDKNSTEHNFVGTFKSFCHRHVKGKKVTQPLPDEKCCICYDNILGPGKRFNTVNMIRAPCCKNGWFHKYCLAAFAKTAGYFFKCPLCNDSKVFRQRLAYKSIFIPDRDAAWELEPNAFAELLERPNVCVAKTCCAEGGRESQHKRNEFLFCSTCGSVAIHRLCMTVQVEHFFCDDCASLTAKIESSSVVNITANQQNKHDEEEDEDIDVCDDFDVSSLNNFRNQIAYGTENTDDTIKPLGIGKKISVLDDTSDSDSNSNEAGCNFLNSNSEEDEIKPLGILKNNKYKIVDYNTSPKELDDDVVLSQNYLKRTNRILSNQVSDTQNTSTSCKRQKRLTSSETESLFDSGAESDRSGSSAYKCNSKSSLENSTSDFSEKSDLKVLVHVKKMNTLEIERRVNRRFISLSDGTKDNENKSRPKRCHSEGMETYYSFLEKEEECVNKTDKKEEPNIEVAHGKILDLKIEILNNEERNSRSVLKTHTPPSNETNKNLSTNNFVPSEMIDCPNSVPATPKMSHMRLRSRSEDVSKRSPRVERRRSCLQSPCSRPLHQITEIQRSKRPSESLESTSIKRSRLDSVTDKQSCTLTQNHEHMTALYEDENNYARKQSPSLKARTSRGRSPLSANLCDVYAYSTLPYVKKLNAQKIDKTAATEDVIDMQPNLPVVGNIFSKNKPNIPQCKTLEQPKPEVKEKGMEDVKTNQKKPATATSYNIYEMFVATDKSKTQKNKIKRIPSQKSPNSFQKGISILPSNQTKIESFFKRI